MRSEVRRRLIIVREERMWTQGRLAEEAGVSPTTVSGIESGRISRPHFGTLRKLAWALGVEPEKLVARPDPEGGTPSAFSLGWARSTPEEDFERGLEDASLESLDSLSRELSEEQSRLQRLYGEFPRGSEQRRFMKRQIRDVAAQAGSVTTSAMFHRDSVRTEPTRREKGETTER